MDEVNINVKEHQVVGTLDRITSPVNMKSVCRKKTDGRNIPEGDHSAVRSLKGALMAARGSEGRLQPQPATVGRPRRLLFLRQEQEQPHSETLKSSVQGKNLGGEERESVSRRSPSHRPIQKEVEELPGSFQSDGEANKSGGQVHVYLMFILEGTVLLVLIRKFLE